VAIGKGKSNAGQGGKLGHSNQDHWLYTEEVKEAARKQRRLHAKVEIKSGLEEATEPEPPDANVSDEFSE
jgi:hypothetical protein